MTRPSDGTPALAGRALVPSAPVGAVAAAGAGAAVTGALRRPLAAVLLLIFFFPASALLGLVVGAAVASLAISELGDREPSPEPLGFGR